MPVLDDSASANTGIILPGNTSGSTSAPHTVNTSAPHVGALGAILWTGNQDASGADFDLTFGGTSMTQAHAPIQLGADHHSYMIPYKLPAGTVPGGTHTVEASFTGMPTSLLTQQIKFVCLTLSGVDSIGDPVSGGGGAATHDNNIDVDSVLPAHRVISFHGCAGINYFTGQNLALRASASSPFNLAGQLIAQDAPGAPTVTCAANMALATQLWGVFGFAVTPAVVNIDAVFTLSPLVLAAAAGIYRVATPDPARTWPIPTQPGVLPDPMPPGFPAVSR
jgi:hypothetical protein